MTRPSSPVVMLEFNELTPSLMDKFIAAGELPNFRQLRDQSEVFTTDAEEEGDNLQPWVQWVTAHTGLSAAEYGITRLSDGHKLQFPAIWDVLSEAGYRVWVCGSMNARYDKPLNGYLLPDPWSTGLRPYPEGEFGPYYDFVRLAVQEHTNASTRPSKRAALKFLTYMLGHGMSAATVRTVLGQLWQEKRTKRYQWRRASVLDQIQWDLFRHFYRRFRPHFSTFFINSTAHYQHSHWREMDPSAFRVKPSPDQVDEYQGAILYGYKQMDRMIGRFLSLLGPDTTIIFATALSQQPYTGAEVEGGRYFYRLRNLRVLADLFGLRASEYTYHPVMADQFALRFPTEAAAEQVRTDFKHFRIGPRAAFHIVRTERDLMVQCSEAHNLPPDTVIRDDRTGRAIPFYDVFYRLENLQSGHHHPDGILWVRRPNCPHRVHSQKITLRSLAPAVLEMFGVTRPEYMTSMPFSATLVPSH